MFVVFGPFCTFNIFHVVIGSILVMNEVFLQLLGSREAASLPPHHRHPACVNLGHCHRLKQQD